MPFASCTPGPAEWNESSGCREGIWPNPIVASRRDASRAGALRHDSERLAAVASADCGFCASGGGGAHCRIGGHGGSVCRDRPAIGGMVGLDEIAARAAAGQDRRAGEQSEFRLDRAGDHPMRGGSRAERRYAIFSGHTGGRARRQPTSMACQIQRRGRQLASAARLPGHAGWAAGRFAAACPALVVHKFAIRDASAVAAFKPGFEIPAGGETRWADGGAITREAGTCYWTGALMRG